MSAAQIQPVAAVSAHFEGPRVSDVFQEVQEEYRRQQLTEAWAKYRIPIIAGTAALILGVAGYQGWTYWQGKQVEQSSRELEAVGDLMRAKPDAQKDAADRLAKLAASGSGGYPLLARFQEAGMRAEMRDMKAAIVIYDDIARSNSDAMFRELAAVRAAVLLSETEPLDKMKARLEPIANGTGPWKATGQELLAYAYWRANKTADAIKLYDEILKTENVPNGTKQRALEMKAVLKAGLKVSDVRPPPRVALPDMPTPDIGPLLLQPATPTPEQPGSLLGPTPTVPTTPTP